MNDAFIALGWCAAVLLTLAIAIVLTRWAKKGGRGAAMVGSALVLLLGAGLVPERPQQRMEQAKEDQGKKGSQSSGADK